MLNVMEPQQPIAAAPQPQSDPNLKACPSCGTQIATTAYFCSNCGKKIKEPPPSTKIGKQISLYLVSFFFPPFGLIPSLRYLAYDDSKAKLVGLIGLALTLLSIFLAIKVTIDIVNQLNVALNSVNQLNGATQLPGMGL